MGRMALMSDRIRVWDTIATAVTVHGRVEDRANFVEMSVRHLT